MSATIGRNLSDSDIAKFARCGIPRELAQSAAHRVDSREGAETVGRNGSGDYAGIVFPYLWPGDTNPREYRLRLDHPELEQTPEGPKERRKYLAPPGRGNLLYFAPDTLPEWLSDPNIPIVFTEGEKKTLAVSTLAWHDLSESAESPRFLAVGLPGVWNWRGTVGKTAGPDGDRRNIKGVIPDVEKIHWSGRAVTIAFDVNVTTNESVQAARTLLTRELNDRGATVRWFVWPETLPQGINGIDDLLGAWGPDRVLDLLTNAREIPNRATDTNLTDAGNGEFLAAVYGARFRHDHARRRDLLYAGHRWHQDATSDLIRMAKEAARRRYVLAANVDDPEKRRKIAAWAIQSEGRSRIEAALAMARSEAPVSDDGNDWDARPMLLAVQNGVVDLETGKLRNGRPDDRLILHTPVFFDLSARAPRFERFIREVFKNDAKLIDFVHRALGYSLTGLTREQVLFILWGSGANGKSVLLSIIREAMGEYGYNMPFSTVELKDRTSIPNDVAALADKRFITASETNESARFNEARIKALTGGDPITARFLHSEFFTFKPVGKFWLAVNHKPRVSDDSYGFWRRVRLIPFTRQFRDKKADPELEKKLQKELPGILAWLVRGCLKWQKKGLKPPAAVLNATESYREESDPLGQFIAECGQQETGKSVTGSDAYKAYQSWAESQGFREREILSSTTFGRRLGDRFESKKTKNGKIYEGVGF